MAFRRFLQSLRKHAQIEVRRSNMARLSVKPLERRELLTGNWTAVANAVPSSNGTGTMLLLSDGSVMVQGGAGSPSTSWYKLTPDSSGNYANGTWTTLASMHVGRRFYGSTLLPDGRVMVVGGEYATDKGDTNTGEIYDPVANTWTTIANFPVSQFGDGNLDVLADGRVLATAFSSSVPYIYNPASNSWTAGPTHLNSDSFSEEGLVKLRGGSILNYEIQGSQPQTGQRFVPGATDETSSWVAAGSVPVRLDTNGGNNGIVPELGPGVLLNDGRVFWIGATNHTALYSLSTNSWTAGPDIPNNLGAFDAPGAVEPNGKVLFSAGTQDGVNFPGPTTVFEYDPSSNTIAQVTASGPNLNVQPFQTRMLVLPSGQVLFTNSGTSLFLYNPDSGQSSSWAPDPTVISGNFDGSATLSGFTLTGGSEGAAYGDDAQMATNFPVIRVTDPNGNVAFARTYNWSHADVQDFSNLQSVQFTMPNGFSANEINVIASGVSSSTNLYVTGTSGNDTITLDTFTIFGLQFISVNVNGNSSSWFAPTLSSVFVNTAGGNDTVNVNNTWGSVSTIISSGSGGDTINIGTGGSVQGIQGYVKIDNPPSFSTINLDDSADGTARTVTLGSYTPFADSTFGYIFGLAPAEIDYEYADTRDVNITTGSGIDTVNVLSTGGIGTTSISNSGGRDLINVGQGNTQNILATLNIENPPSFSEITVDDSSDTNVQTITLGTFTPSGDTAWGSISGIAPASINYEFADTDNVTIKTSDVSGDVINVQATGGIGTTRVFANGFDTVNVGNAGSVQSINAKLDLQDIPSFITVNVDDSADSSARTVTLNTFTGGGSENDGDGDLSGRIRGLAPADINYEYFDTSSVTIRGGTGGNTWNVRATGKTVNLFANGFDTVNVGDAGSVQGINGALNLQDVPSFITLNVDDSADNSSRTVTLSTFTGSSESDSDSDLSGRISGLAPADITYEYFDTSSVTILGGNAGNTWNVLGTGKTTNIVANGANVSVIDTVNVGNAGSVSGILGALTLEDDPSYLVLNVDDSADTAARTVTLSNGTLSDGDAAGIIAGLAPATIAYEYFDTASVMLTGGNHGNTFNVQGTGVPTTINGGTGIETFNVGSTTTATSLLSGIGSNLTVVGGGGADTLNIRDGGQTAGQSYALSASTLSGSDFGGTIAYTVEKVVLNLGSGDDSVTATALPTGVKVDGGGGNNTLTGPNLTNTWTISSANAGFLSSATKLAFSNIQNLVGGTGNDTFKFTGGSPSLAGTLSGGSAGSDKIDYTSYTGGAISVALSSPTSGAASLIGGGFSSIESVNGSNNAGDTLTGTNAATVWAISALNGGKAGTFSFTKIENLVGGTGADTFKISSGKGVSGSINAGGGANVLDYSAWTTGVVVNLQSGAATGVGTTVSGFNILNGGKVNDSLTGTTGNDIIRGNAGDDVIKGNGGSDILIGGAGNDTISVPLSSGRSILIGSQGNDHLTGGTAGCILIGGNTSYDTFSGANDTALNNILNEWLSTTDAYATRIAKIRAGVGSGKFNTTTVHDDATLDILTGQTNFAGGDGDWFWAGVGTNPDSTNAEGGEQIN